MKPDWGSNNQRKVKLIMVIAVFAFAATLHAGLDIGSLLGRPNMFWWPGSMDNFMSILDSEATSSEPPYHKRSFHRCGHDNQGWEIVYERADRVVVFMIGSSRKYEGGCEITFVQIRAYTPANYERVLHGDPRGPAAPEIP
jgi:hypothetical protein